MAIRSGAIVPFPEAMKERQSPRKLEVGPKDTEADQVLEITYNPLTDMQKWLGGPFLAPVPRHYGFNELTGYDGA
ncbi:hypothetical protein M885DRAFT_517942 [Pelagophyceae sp. CCMP2097]|nr:hypothetical protein M885DRAFT_517942 [Pelagophyceae sp. CCMP2097]